MINCWFISREIAARLMSFDLTDDKSTLVQVMAWCHQATSHYLSQCWPRSLSPYGVTRPQWVKKGLTHFSSSQRRNTSTSVSSGGEETKKKRGRPRQHKVKEEETTGKSSWAGFSLEKNISSFWSHWSESLICAEWLFMLAQQGFSFLFSEKEKEKVKEDDAYAQVPAEKALQYAVILAEINCKMMTQNFKPF